jgi:hypothetical protein
MHYISFLTTAPFAIGIHFIMSVTAAAAAVLVRELSY